MQSPADREFEALTDPAFCPILAELAAQPTISLSMLDTLRRQFGRDTAEAILRLANSRRKAVGKFIHAEKLWLDPVRVEQATHHMVAEHKAKRFQGLAVADICCGLGGDSFALARQAKGVASVDLDRDALRRLEFNADVYGFRSQILPVQGDANHGLFDRSIAVHIDPDRRAADHIGRPRFSLDDCQPSLQTLLSYMTAHNGGAIKLSPGSDFESLEKRAELLGVRTEKEIISLSGECREATIWFGQLAGKIPRRATILPGQFEFAGQPGGSIRKTAVPKPGDWLFELDPAVIRSGLAANFAAANQLHALTPDGAWLFTDHIHQNISGMVQKFQVMDSASVDRRAVRQMLRNLGWSSAVVKTRGRIHAAEIQKWLEKQPSGQATETLIVITVPGLPSRAIAAKRLQM
jgi:hypothetical protein